MKEEEVQRCASCKISYPYHAQDCPVINYELFNANLIERQKWEAEPWVDREKGVQILQAIQAMLAAPNHEAMLQRKAAILEEI